MQTIPARGGEQLPDNRHRSKPGQKCQVSSPRPATHGVRRTTSRRTAQAGPAPRPLSGRMRMYARTYQSAATVRSGPTARSLPAHSPASAHVPPLPRPEASGAGLATPAPPPPPQSPRPSITGNAPARILLPDFPAPQYGVTSACASCSSARGESRSRERARSVSEAGARLVDDNKFVAQWRSPPRRRRRPSGSRAYSLRTDRALRKPPAWGARFRSATRSRRA